MPKATAGTELVPVDELAERFPVLAGGDMMEALTVNLTEDDGVTVFDLDRVKIPAGGGRTWEVPALDGVEAAPELVGVIVGVIARRSFWESSLDDSQGDASPPDCTSEDNKHGRGVYGKGSTGNPSGLCADCPMNKFQEVKGRNVKPCSEQRLVVFLPEGKVLPIVVQLPPTSMRELKHYMMRLASNGVPYYQAITTLALKRVDASPAYSIVDPKLSGRIPSESAKDLKKLGDDIVAAYRAQSSSPSADA